MVVLVLAAIGAVRARRRAVGWVLAATVVLSAARMFGFVPLPSPAYRSWARSASSSIASRSTSRWRCWRGWRSTVQPSAGARAPASSGMLALAGLVAVVAELAWLGTVPRPPRLDPYAPAPWVERLQSLDATTPGRLSGPVALAPPLISALGLRDLRAIDVLTPRIGYEFVSQVVAPSEGLTWILADPTRSPRRPPPARPRPTCAGFVALTTCRSSAWRRSRAPQRAHDGCRACSRRSTPTRSTPQRSAAASPRSTATGASTGRAARRVASRYRRARRTASRSGSPLPTRWTPPCTRHCAARLPSSATTRRSRSAASAPGRTSGCTPTDLAPTATPSRACRSRSPHRSSATIFVGGIGPAPGPEAEDAEVRDELRAAHRGARPARPALRGRRAHLRESRRARRGLARDRDRSRGRPTRYGAAWSRARAHAACVADPARVPRSSD